MAKIVFFVGCFLLLSFARVEAKRTEVSQDRLGVSSSLITNTSADAGSSGLPETLVNALETVPDAGSPSDNCFPRYVGKDVKVKYLTDCYPEPTQEYPHRLCDQQNLKDFGKHVGNLQKNTAGNSGSNVLVGNGFVAKDLPIKELEKMLNILGGINGRPSMITPICLYTLDENKADTAWIVMHVVGAELPTFPVAEFDVKSPKFTRREWGNGAMDFKTASCYTKWAKECKEDNEVPRLSTQKTILKQWSKLDSIGVGGKKYTAWPAGPSLTCAELAAKWMVKDIGLDELVPDRFECTGNRCEMLKNMVEQDSQLLLDNRVTDYSLLMMVYPLPEHAALPNSRFPFLTTAKTKLWAGTEGKFALALGIIDYGVDAPGKTASTLKFKTTTMLRKRDYKAAFTRVIAPKSDQEALSQPGVSPEKKPYIYY